MTSEVHWHEGLFLQPHHLQVFQHELIGRQNSERRLSWSYPYGVVEAKISPDELENMRLRFDRLRVIMPSGLEVNVPESADLPALDIAEMFETSNRPFTVSLGVPLYYPKRANAFRLGEEADSRVKRLYKVVEKRQTDENTGENPQSVLYRRTNARLMFENDDRSDMELVPLVRITHAAGEEIGMPRVDTNFVPPCFTISGSGVMRDMLRDLANQVEAARKEHVVMLTRGGFNMETIKGTQIQQMLRLRTLNSYAARLLSMVSAPSGIAPFTMYLELRGLLGELAGLVPDLDPYDVVPYNHENPVVPFMELVAKIRSQLRTVSSSTWIKVEFKLVDGIYEAKLEDKHISGPNEYFLGIKTGKDPRELARLVEDADEFKFICKTMAKTRVRGVKLTEERHPPMQLPSQVGLHYFRLQRSESARMWERIASEREIAINFQGVESAGFDSATLYMTVPSE